MDTILPGQATDISSRGPGKAEWLCAHVCKCVSLYLSVYERLSACLEKLKGHVCVTIHGALGGLGKIQKIMLNIKGAWRARWKSGHRAGRGSPWEVTAANGKAQALPLGEGREKQAPCWVGMGDKPKNGVRVMAKQPETSYCWGPSPNGGGAERPHGGPQSCIFNIVCIYGAHLPCGRVLCFMGTCRGTLGPPPSGARTWREGFPALSEGRARDLTLHSWKLGQGPGPQRPAPTPGAVPLPGGSCRALMEPAGHGTARQPCCCPPCGLASHAPEVGAGRRPPPRASRPPRQLNTACGLSPREGASSSTEESGGLGGRVGAPGRGAGRVLPRPRDALQSMLVLTEREMLSVCAETEMSSWSTGLW